MTPAELATISKWIAWISLIGGSIALILGWRARGTTGESTAPVGALGDVDVSVNVDAVGKPFESVIVSDPF